MPLGHTISFGLLVRVESREAGKLKKYGVLRSREVLFFFGVFARRPLGDVQGKSVS